MALLTVVDFPMETTCSCKQDTKERYWGQQFWQMERHISVRPTEMARPVIACSKRSDSGERCEVKKPMKSRGGLGREVPLPFPRFYFFAFLLLRIAPHYLNAWNRLDRSL